MSQGPHFILGHILDNLSGGYMTCTGEPEVWYSNPVVRNQWEQNIQQKRVFGTYRNADNSYMVSEDVDTSSFKRQLFAELVASASFPPEDNYPSVTILVGDQITSQAINAASGRVLVLRGALVHIPHDAVFSGLLIVESSNVEIGGGNGPYLTGKMLLIAGEHAFDDGVRIAINTGEVTPQVPFVLEPRICPFGILAIPAFDETEPEDDILSDGESFYNQFSDKIESKEYAVSVIDIQNPNLFNYIPSWAICVTEVDFDPLIPIRVQDVISAYDKAVEARSGRHFERVIIIADRSGSTYFTIPSLVRSTLLNRGVHEVIYVYEDRADENWVEVMRPGFPQ